jgi:hypothetical protein
MRPKLEEHVLPIPPYLLPILGEDGVIRLHLKLEFSAICISLVFEHWQCGGLARMPFYLTGGVPLDNTCPYRYIKYSDGEYRFQNTFYASPQSNEHEASLLKENPNGYYKNLFFALPTGAIRPDFPSVHAGKLPEGCAPVTYDARSLYDSTVVVVNAFDPVLFPNTAVHPSESKDRNPFGKTVGGMRENKPSTANDGLGGGGGCERSSSKPLDKGPISVVVSKGPGNHARAQTPVWYMNGGEEPSVQDRLSASEAPRKQDLSLPRYRAGKCFTRRL